MKMNHHWKKCYCSIYW